MSTDDIARVHDEVVTALRAIGDARRGEAIRLDRGSALEHLGIGFPALRARVKQGFTFTAGRPPDDEGVRRVWDALWCTSPVGDVLFAAIEFHAPLVRGRRAAERAPGLWPRLRDWPGRVDNWCHADALAGLYSRLLEHHFDAVHAQLVAWNADVSAEGAWRRRLSLTSLVHYSGRHAVFLPPEAMLPLLAACVADHRQPVETALGWVLRELGEAHPRAADAFIARHRSGMSPRALRRALERKRTIA